MLGEPEDLLALHPEFGHHILDREPRFEEARYDPGHRLDRVFAPRRVVPDGRGDSLGLVGIDGHDRDEPSGEGRPLPSEG